MARSICTTFTPPEEWPSAEIETALYAAWEDAAALTQRVDQLYPRDQAAADLKRAALEKLREGRALLMRAYEVEMEARLVLWRGLGYRL